MVHSWVLQLDTEQEAYTREESCLYDGHSCLCWGILVCRAGLVQTALSHLHSQWADVGQGTPWWQPSAYLGPTWGGQTCVQATHPADSLTDQCDSHLPCWP